MGSDPLYLYDAGVDPDFGPEPRCPRDVSGEEYPDADIPSVVDTDSY